MRLLKNAFVCVLGSALMLLGGCQRVSMEKTVELDAMQINAPFIVTGPSRDQEVTVTVRPEKGAPVDAYILLEKDRAAAEKEMEANQPPKGALAGRQKIDSDTVLTAKVPAKNEYAVLVGNAHKTTKVTVKVDAR